MDPHCHYNIESLMSANFITVAFLKFLKNHHLLLFYLTTSYSLVKQVFQKMVGMEGLEPPRIAPTDFESVVFAIPPHPHY